MTYLRGYQECLNLWQSEEWDCEKIKNLSVCEATVEWQGLDCPCVPVVQCCWTLCYVIKGAEVNSWRGTVTVWIYNCFKCSYVASIRHLCVSEDDWPTKVLAQWLSLLPPSRGMGWRAFGAGGMLRSRTLSSGLACRGMASSDQKVTEELRAESVIWH